MSEPLRLLGALAVAGTLFSACTTPKTTAFQREEFQPGDTYTRSFSATGAQVCEAARRALLSQGYVVNSATADAVNARKSFQQAAEAHVEIEFRVTCAPELQSTERSMVFASALQDSYALKKSNNSASVGVGVIGSLSLPFSSSDDALVKVASETVTASAFYDRYFRLLASYLATTAPPAPAPAPVPAPEPAVKP